VFYRCIYFFRVLANRKSWIKTSLIEEFDSEQAKAPKPISSFSSQWSRVYIEGFYDPAQQVLIDNQINNGKVGYKIYTPFYYDQDKAIFVDRGWISQGKTRNDLPNINFNAETAHNWKFGQARERGSSWAMNC